MLIDYKYKDYLDSPAQLAKRIIDKLEEEGEVNFPLDPFELLSKNDIIYQFKDFKELEGIYIVPENDEDIAVVGINLNRPITRQRFTAAHELCHHIKDRTSITCPIGGKKNEIEKFADKFASELLMPSDYFMEEVKKLIKNKYVSFDDALRLSIFFGVSFTSCVFTLAYRYSKSLIEGNTTAKELRKRIRKYKPEKKKLELGLNGFEHSMRKKIIDSYSYFFEHDYNFIWYKFKNEYIYNENRMEGSKLDIKEVSEIVTDLRLHKQESQYCIADLQDIIETAGQSSLYDFILEGNAEISAYSLLKLHAMLYQYAPHPEAGGKFRDSNNLVTESKFETCDYKEIMNKIIELDNIVKELITKVDSYNIADYVEQAVKIHHRITLIHPFHDGNGRISRIFLNWLLQLKALPPVYLKYERKKEYYKALQVADLNNDFDPLCEVFYNEIMGSMIELYDGRRILEENI